MTERTEPTEARATYVDTKGKRIPEHALAIWFAPQNIRDHFDGDDGELAEWVHSACEARLVEVGFDAMYDERLWEAFHAVLCDVIRERLDA